jgi:hypothetical protein
MTGFFLFGVRFVLDRATNAFPKSPFVYVVRFRLLEDNCEMEVAGETFRFNPIDSTARAPVYDHMIGVLRNALERKPWDVEKQNTMGFGFQRPQTGLPCVAVTRSRQGCDCPLSPAADNASHMLWTALCQQPT